MPAPVLQTDLVLLTESESTAGFTRIGGGANIGASATFAMQGTNSVDKGISGSAFQGAGYTQGAITPGADTHFFMWLFTASPSICNTLQNGGACVVVGSSSNNYVRFHIDGNDTYGAGGRVGRCYPVRYRDDSTTSVPYRTVVGSPPSANPSYWGSGIQITTGLGRMSADVMRYGTGAYLTAGESGDPITLDGWETISSAIANRYGLLTKLSGSYLLQGKFCIGQNSSKVATLAYFEDSFKTILIEDTPHSLTDFSEIVIDHASTQAIFNFINISAEGTNNRGNFRVESANPTVTINNGVWSNIGTTVLRSNSTVTGLIWLGAESITLNGALLTNCSIKNSTATSAIIASNLSEIPGCDFLSSGSGHAVDLGTISATTSMTWDNDDSGYAGTDGSTGNETILVSVDSGQTLTINVVAGRTTPTINNTGAGTVTVVSPQPIATIEGLIVGSVFVIYDLDDADPQNLGTELQRNNSALATETYSYAGAKAGDAIIITMYIDGYKPLQKVVTLSVNDSTITLEPETESN